MREERKGYERLHHRLRLAVCVMGIALSVTRLAAQEARPLQPEPGLIAPVTQGAAFGIAGFLAGGFVGYSFVRTECNSSPEEFCGIGESFVGAAMGGTLGMAAGVHWGNRSRGNFGKDLLASGLTWATGIGLAAATHWEDNTTTLIFVSLPVVQLAVTTSVERSTGRSKERASQHAFMVVPTRRGAAFVGRLPLPIVR